VVSYLLVVSCLYPINNSLFFRHFSLDEEAITSKESKANENKRNRISTSNE
jgi:hypothetical protein